MGLIQTLYTLSAGPMDFPVEGKQFHGKVAFFSPSLPSSPSSFLHTYFYLKFSYLCKENKKTNKQCSCLWKKREEAKEEGKEHQLNLETIYFFLFFLFLSQLTLLHAFFYEISPKKKKKQKTIQLKKFLLIHSFSFVLLNT